MIIKTHLHKKGFALALVLKQRFAASRKLPILCQVLVEEFILFSRTIRAALIDSFISGWGGEEVRYLKELESVMNIYNSLD